MDISENNSINLNVSLDPFLCLVAQTSANL